MKRMKTEDLGVAAYLKMHGFKVSGRRGKEFFFDVNDPDETDFLNLQVEYPNGPYHTFDSEIMALKKLPHYLPPEV